MLYLWLVILVVLNAVWLALVLFGLPGNWLMVLTTALFAWWWRDEGVFSGAVLIAIAVLAVLGELVEFFAGTAGARRAGASWRASLAGILGAILGAAMGTVVLPVPIVGTVVGACLGVALAVWLVETSRGVRPEQSLQRAVGAGVGEFLGIVSKFAIGIAIWLIVAVAAFWP